MCLVACPLYPFFYILEGNAKGAHQPFACQDINEDGVLNEVDMKAETAGVCIVVNTAIESFYLRVVSEYVANAVYPK
jgi:hypothetical protein